MNNNFFSTVYIPVKVSERLPEKVDHYFVEEKSYGKEVAFYTDKFTAMDDSGENHDVEATEWLEPITNRYIFTKEELDKLIKEKEAAVYAKLHYSQSCYQRLHAAAKRLADDVEGCQIGALGNDSLRNIKNFFLIEEKEKSQQ